MQPLPILLPETATLPSSTTSESRDDSHEANCSSTLMQPPLRLSFVSMVQVTVSEIRLELNYHPTSSQCSRAERHWPACSSHAARFRCSGSLMAFACRRTGDSPHVATGFALI